MIRNENIFCHSSAYDNPWFSSLTVKKTSGSDGILAIIKNINLYIGAGIYLVSAVLNIIVLCYLDYSVVLPLTSLTYIWTMILSYMILKEQITKRKVVGVVLRLAGAVCVSL